MFEKAWVRLQVTGLLKCWLARVGQSTCLACLLSGQEALYKTQWDKGVSCTHHTLPFTLLHGSPLVFCSTVQIHDARPWLNELNQTISFKICSSWWHWCVAIQSGLQIPAYERNWRWWQIWIFVSSITLVWRHRPLLNVSPAFQDSCHASCVKTE